MSSQLPDGRNGIGIVPQHLSPIDIMPLDLESFPISPVCKMLHRTEDGTFWTSSNSVGVRMCRSKIFRPSFVFSCDIPYDTLGYFSVKNTRLSSLVCQVVCRMRNPRYV